MTTPNRPYNPLAVYEPFADQDGYNPFLDERSMELNDVIDLLSLLAGADFRKPDPAAATVWLVAATAGYWTKGAAFRAAAKHIVHSIDFAKPAHITALIKAEKASQPEARLAIEGSNAATANARSAAREFFRRFPQHLKAFRFPPPGSARAKQNPDEAKRHRDEAEQSVARYWSDLDARRAGS